MNKDEQLKPLCVDAAMLGRLLGVSRAKAYLMMSAKELPVVSLGNGSRLKRVPYAAVEAYIEKHLQDADSAAA
jgi:excisionase family DNA binding protein